MAVFSSNFDDFFLNLLSNFKHEVLIGDREIVKNFKAEITFLIKLKINPVF